MVGLELASDGLEVIFDFFVKLVQEVYSTCTSLELHGVIEAMASVAPGPGLGAPCPGLGAPSEVSHRL